MAIKIFQDKIVIGQYTLQEIPTGFSIDGYIDAGSYSELATTAYISGGVPNATPIITFPMSTPFATSTSHGTLTSGKEYLAGQNSSTDGYISGGRTFPPLVVINSIDYFPFATTPASNTSLGGLSQSRFSSTGLSSKTTGYNAGGGVPPLSPIFVNTIDSFPFSTSPITSTDIGDMSIRRAYAAGQQSLTDGYVSGGYSPPSTVIINKFPFSTPFATATEIGTLSQARLNLCGQSSATHGYNCGGSTPIVPALNTIDRFPFSTPFATATDIADLSIIKDEATGHYSGSEGFIAGGTGGTTTVEKFPFSSSYGTTLDAGDLSTAKYYAAGHQG